LYFLASSLSHLHLAPRQKPRISFLPPFCPLFAHSPQEVTSTSSQGASQNGRLSEDFPRIPFRELPRLHTHKILVDCLPSQHRIYERYASYIPHLRLLTSTYPHFYEQEIERQFQELTHFVDVFSRTSSRNSCCTVRRSVYLNNRSPQHTRVNQVFVQLVRICRDRNIEAIWEEQPDENEEGVDVLLSPEFERRAKVRRVEKR